MPIDYKRYPPNWKTEIRPRILERAQNKCEWCGVRNESIIVRTGNKWRYICSTEHDMIHAKVRYSGYNYSGALKRLGFTKIVLTIAHLDHDADNHDVTDDRLAALCQRCHLKHDMKNHVNNRKYGRHWKKQQTNLFNDTNASDTDSGST